MKITANTIRSPRLFSKPEVKQFDVSFRVYTNILRFQIAIKYTVFVQISNYLHKLSGQ
jgi:hypothetical protein